MTDIRTLSPELYRQVVGYLRQFMLTTWDDDAED
jgi:hypothetical protein